MFKFSIRGMKFWRNGAGALLVAMAVAGLTVAMSAGARGAPENSRSDGVPKSVASTALKDNEQAIFARVQRIVATQLEVDAAKVTPNASFKKDLGADELDMAELVMMFEEEFNIAIPDEVIAKFVTVEDAVRYIVKASKAPSQ